MTTTALTKPVMFPSVFDDFFKPWNEWFDDSRLISRVMTVPSVNIIENGDHYQVSLAAPGLKKEDFNVSLEGDMLTISSKKEEKKEEKDAKFTRKEYSYSSFSRSFNLPEDVKPEAINANYEDGVLTIQLPRKSNGKKQEIARKIEIK